MDYSHWHCTTQNGVNFDFLKQARKVLEQEGVKSVDQRQYVLLLDEMKVKTGLVFSKSSGELVGFADLGSANRDIESLLSKNPADSPHTPSLAKKMLVFMIRPVFKPSLSFPVAAYPTTDLNGIAVTWEVIKALEPDDFPVIAVTADGASPDRTCNFYRMCGEKKQGGVPFKTKNPYADRDLYFIYDPPYAMKMARNCLSNSHAHKQSRDLQVIILPIQILPLCIHSPYAYQYVHIHTHIHTLADHCLATKAFTG